MSDLEFDLSQDIGTHDIHVIQGQAKSNGVVKAFTYDCLEMSHSNYVSMLYQLLYGLIISITT